MTASLVAGVDCSTQATKVVVVDVDSGRLVASGRCANPVHRDGPASESDPGDWWTALAAVLVQTGQAGRIAGISIAAQQLGLVVLDEQHAPRLGLARLAGREHLGVVVGLDAVGVVVGKAPEVDDAEVVAGVRLRGHGAS